MTIRIIRLGAARQPDEGTRIGTVRHPPRGMPKAQFASKNWYDVWFPTLAEAAHALNLLAAMSHRSHFAIGCYCEDEAHCHRSALRQLLAERGAEIA